MWIHGSDLIPLVGGWIDEDEDSDRCVWSIPHSAAWLKSAYDDEFNRRHEHNALLLAGDSHPIRRVGSSLLSQNATEALPPPLTSILAAMDQPLSADPRVPTTQLSVKCAGSSSATDKAIGAAAGYYASGGPAGADDSSFVTLAVCLDYGEASTDNLTHRADLQGVALALRIAAAVRESVTVVHVSTNSPFAAETFPRLLHAPLGRRRLLTDATDTRNEIQAYQLLRKLHSLPQIWTQFDSTPNDSTNSVSRRAQLASYAEAENGREFPNGSDWCILELKGERVHSPIGHHFLANAASQRSKAFAATSSQGRALRIALPSLPTDRSRVLSRRSKGSSIEKAAFQSLSHTHVTLRELFRWLPKVHSSDNCWFPHCAPLTPANQDHTLFKCNAVAPERVALIDAVTAALRNGDPLHSPYWLALTRGKRVGAERLQSASLAALATSSVASVLVSGKPTALIQSDLSRQSPQPVPAMGAFVRVSDSLHPPRSMSKAELMQWCSGDLSTGPQWAAVPEQLLLNMLFRWQALEATNPSDLRPDSLLRAVAKTIAEPTLMSNIPDWPVLHQSIVDILMDTLGVSACLAVCALLASRRSASTLLALGAPTTPLDSMVGCRSWSNEALHDITQTSGTLICLPMTHKAARAYNSLVSLQRRGPPGQCILLVPWGRPDPSILQQRHTNSVRRLLSAGYVLAAIIPAVLVTVTQLDAFGPRLYTQRSSKAPWPFLLLLSRKIPPQQLAEALTALGAFTEMRSGITSQLPCLQPYPWQLRRRIFAADTTSDQIITLLKDPNTWATVTTFVTGELNYVDATLAHAAILRARRPEEHLLPNLLLSLPATESDSQQQPWSSVSYTGAALDDYAQPMPNTGCDTLQRTTLQTFTAGIWPTVLDNVIGTWIRNRRSSFSGQAAHRQQQLPQVAPTQPRAAIGPTTCNPVPLPQSVPAAAPLQERSSHRTRHGNDATASIIGIVRKGHLLWIQHNTLMARKHVERGLIPGQWRRSAARKCAARPAPPEEPNATGNTSAAPASTAAVVPSPLPTPEVVPLASVEPVLTPGAAPSVPIPTHSNSQPPPLGRVRHPGRDPTCTIDALPGEGETG